jgi:putative superfamily III holin-X
MHLGWSALIVTGLWLVIGVALFLAGRSRMRQVNPVPEQTVQSLKEDKEWITGRKS